MTYLNFSDTVRFELTTYYLSTRFQDERHKPDSTKYPYINKIYSCPFTKVFIKKKNSIII